MSLGAPQKEPEIGPAPFTPELCDTFTYIIPDLTCSNLGKNFACVAARPWDVGLLRIMSLKLRFIFF